MASIRVSPSVHRLIADAFKRLPVLQMKEQFVEDAVRLYMEELKSKSFQVRSLAP